MKSAFFLRKNKLWNDFIMKTGVVKVVLLLVCCFPGLAWAQENKLLADRMETVFKMLRPTDRKVLVEGYVEAMTSSLLSVEEKEAVENVFQELLDLHVAVVPELQDYVSCVNAFCKRQEKENLNVWLAGVRKALAATERKRTVVKTYLESLSGLATRQILYDGNGFLWQFDGKIAWQAEPLRVDFQDGNLICATRKDTIRIYSTRGTYLWGEEDVQAQGGQVKWKENEEMWGDLSRYTIHLKNSSYTADSVWFHYESRYPRPLLGTLKDNALKYARGKDVPYPEFVSYGMDVEIPNLFKDIHFRGGVAYKGVKFFGIGTEEHPALLHVIPNDSISLKLHSNQFAIDTARIMSGRSAMEILMDGGEITHSNINFLYTYPQHMVTIKRISEQSLHLPFKDSYHQILFDMEEILWPLDSNYLEMRMSSRSGLFKATIESMNFFNDNIYDKIQGMDEINPLNGLLKCSLSLKKNTFTIADYAGFIKKPADQLRKQIILLSYDDFVDFNETRDEVTLKQRLFDYTKARVGKQDYDNIRFFSLPGKAKANAVMDVRNYNLRINGVEKLMISEARNIFAEPSDQRVLFMKNRDMAFNGKLNAGMFDMYGQNLFFSYDKYAITLPKVDSTSMYTAGQGKNTRGRKVQSLIRDITGEIVIDNPDNKSGKKDDPGFPKLNSTGESYVYFDEPAIRNGQYKRDSFYYKIKPYTLSGINDGKRFRYAFNGTLISNIVSPIEDTLRLQEDNALGLTYQTPESGIDLYGKGRICSRIVLNRKGFVASGKVEMNRSRFGSDTILMLPTRLLANTRELNVDAVENRRPAAYGKDLKIQYLPAEGNLQATTASAPFDVYDGRIRHTGSLMVYEQLLDASGKLQIEGAELDSKLFHLQAVKILSQSTALNIASVLNKDIRLNTSNVTADIDLSANKGKFANNAENNRAAFSGSRYDCTFESFTWYMKDAYLNIGIEDSVQLAKIWKIEDINRIPKSGRNLFLSTNPLLDSLSFIAPLARYDLKTGDIDCRWINHVDVANGRFYPARGALYIHANGDIREFESGRLLCERTNPARSLHDVKFKLTGRFDFNGSGNYTYVSEEKKKSIIRFTEIGVDTLKLIYAGVSLKEDASLLLNDGLKYKGKITLYSRQPNLYFAGYAKMTADTAVLKHSWVAVKDYLVADRIRIGLETENRNDRQGRIYNGIYLNTDRSFKPYAAFLSRRLFYKDDLLIGGRGKLEWSAGMKQYIISDTLQDRYYRFRYDPETETVSAFGKIGLDLQIPGIRQKMSGNVAYDMEKRKLEIGQAFYLLDFALLSKMEAVLLKDFADKKLKNIGVHNDLYEKIYEVYGKENTKAMDKHLKGNSVPDSLSQLFVLDSLDIRWNDQTRSYMANGPVKVVAMKGKPVEKTMEVKMEFIRSRSENQYFMYIYDDNLWYYFEYSDGSLYTLSSNEEYNTVVKLEKPEKKVMKNKEGETWYTITLCPDSKKERFLKRVK